MSVSNSTKEAYDKIYKSYKKTVKSEGLDHPYIERFLGYLRPNQHILDAGAGTGFIANEIKALHKLNVTAIDISPKMVKQAKRDFPSLNYSQMDMRWLKFPRNNFDAIFANYSLIHIIEDDVEMTLNGFAKVLKPRGYLYLALQCPITSKQQGGYYPVVYKKKEHLFINLFEEKEIKKHLIKSGFKIICTDIRKPDKKTEFPFNKLFIIAQKK